MEQELTVGQDERIHALLERARASGARDARGRLTPECSALVEELWKVAFNALRAFLRDGRILTAGPIPQSLPLLAEDLDYLSKSAYDREDLAMEMIVGAIDPFVTAVVDGSKWDKERSSLATYFVGRCLINKGAVIEKWVTERRNRQHIREQESSEIWTQLDRLRPFRQESDMLNGFVFELIQGVPLDVRPILHMIAQGFTIADAARMMGISASAARNRLKRWRTNNVVAPLVMDLPESLWPSDYSLIEYLRSERNRQRRPGDPRRRGQSDAPKQVGQHRRTPALPSGPF
ncbi:hypothetical protein DBV08_00025 [Rhodococcus sp. KBW08]|uniref:helix-turn-helix domain-containing protein n=1 Tax=Rhodococcus sp. KBW08 TaxID=2144188 RepID=UPI000F59F4A8|nr:helix-turn-helix domain-containing protein [Rhodococcus sp. KBW08]RQO52727.1 hypothetical protein DBV08_00025 [Rhodococcus sp. KBW08]